MLTELDKGAGTQGATGSSGIADDALIFCNEQEKCGEKLATSSHL